jgi:aspartyl protease family protein
MGKAVMAMLFAVAIAVGWFVPAPEFVEVSTELGQPGNSFNTQHLADAAAIEPDELILERSGDGHYYADVDVDGTETRFMVDTGATGIALTASDAEALGIGWDERELRKVGRGVNGDVFGKIVRLHSVQLGGIEVNDVEAAIIPRGLDVSLLGQSVLSRAGSVRIEDGEMIITA